MNKTIQKSQMTTDNLMNDMAGSCSWDLKENTGLAQLVQIRANIDYLTICLENVKKTISGFSSQEIKTFNKMIASDEDLVEVEEHKSREWRYQQQTVKKTRSCNMHGQFRYKLVREKNCNKHVSKRHGSFNLSAHKFQQLQDTLDLAKSTKDVYNLVKMQIRLQIIDIMDKENTYSDHLKLYRAYQETLESIHEEILALPFFHENERKDALLA